MPDASGWPNAQECAGKVAFVIGEEECPPAIVAELDTILASVIAEFQSPIGTGGAGGTGRRFTPVTETRTFDGNGYARLRVADLVPGEELAVTLNGSTVSDVSVQEQAPGRGWNILVRSGGSLWGCSTAWPLGEGNVSVTGTWAFAASVPTDVREAIRCEVAFRAIVQGHYGTGGGVEIRKQGDTEFVSSGTSAGVSPVQHLHEQYLAAVKRYRDDTIARRARAGRVMS